MSFDEKKYKNTLIYPEKPKPPKELNTIASNLTMEELKRLPELKKKHEEDIEVWLKEREKYHVEYMRLDALFWSDMREEFGFKKNDKFCEALMAKAWDDGHAYGYSEVYNKLLDLSELWSLYKNKDIHG